MLELIRIIKKTPVVSLLAVTLLGGFIIGCSTDSNGFGPTAPSTTEKSVATKETTAPLDINLPDGYSVIRLPYAADPRDGSTLDDPPWDPRLGGPERGDGPTLVPPGMPDLPEPVCSAAWVTTRSSATVEVNGNGCRIPVGAMPYDALVQVCMPDPRSAVADFSPHPLDFNGTGQVFFDLDPVMNSITDPDDLAIFYDPEDDTEAVEMPCYIDYQNNRIVGTTNHFSRYILAGKNNN